MTVKPPGEMVAAFEEPVELAGDGAFEASLGLAFAAALASLRAR